MPKTFLRAFTGYSSGSNPRGRNGNLAPASNADEFLRTATEILGCPIQVISGEEEARLIYHGVAHTTGGPEQRLVVDIGGAALSWLQAMGLRRIFWSRNNFV